MTTSLHETFGRTLSVIWLFAILNIVFRDIHEFTMATTVNEILSGRINGNVMTEEVLLYGAFAVELLLLGFLLSAILPAPLVRQVNLVLAPLAIAGTFFVPPADPDDYFFATVEICAYIAILVLAWRWSPHQAVASRAGGRHAV